jgi:hypothetical protein
MTCHDASDNLCDISGSIYLGSVLDLLMQLIPFTQRVPNKQTEDRTKITGMPMREKRGASGLAHRNTGSGPRLWQLRSGSAVCWLDQLCDFTVEMETLTVLTLRMSTI